ncbi:uncharacterized protein LOC120348554 [Styela clava]
MERLCGNQLVFSSIMLTFIVLNIAVLSSSAPILFDEGDYIGTLDILRSSVEHAFRRFTHKKMDCSRRGGCLTNPTTLKLTNMPDFKKLNQSGENDKQILQANYEALHTYQYFINTYLVYSPEAKSSKIISSLQRTREASDKVVASHASYMTGRSCEEPVQYIERGYPIHPAPSSVLEKVRIYEFLRQYNAFIESFKQTYEGLMCQ